MRIRLALTLHITRDRDPAPVEREVQIDSLIERSDPVSHIGFQITPPRTDGDD